MVSITHVQVESGEEVEGSLRGLMQKFDFIMQPYVPRSYETDRTWLIVKNHTSKFDLVLSV